MHRAPILHRTGRPIPGKMTARSAPANQARSGLNGRRVMEGWRSTAGPAPPPSDPERAGLVWTLAVVALAMMSVGLVVGAGLLGAFGGTVLR